MIKQYEALVDHWRNGALVTAGETLALTEAAAKYDVIAKRLSEKGGAGAGEGAPAAAAPAEKPEVFAAGVPKPATR